MYVYCKELMQLAGQLYQDSLASFCNRGRMTSELKLMGSLLSMQEFCCMSGVYLHGHVKSSFSHCLSRY
jgi:hypothetical protein